jgi:hypothetical protein
VPGDDIGDIGEPDDIDPDEISDRRACPNCEPPSSSPYATGEAYE